MRVAIDAMLLGARRSGVELSILNLLRALSETGRCDYTVHLPAEFHADIGETSRFQLRRSRVRASNRALRIAWEQLVLPRRVRRDGCQILHAPGYLAPLAARTPVVLTVYDVMALTHPHLCRAANRWNFRCLLPASVRMAAAVIVPSDFTANELAKAVAGCGSKTHVIPLAVAASFHERPPDARLDEARIRMGLPARFVLSVGREEPKKNIPFLLKAFHALKVGGDLPHKLVLAGPVGPDAHNIDQAIRRLGLDGDVIRSGFLPQSDLPHLYRLADAFVFPSLCEGFGLPPLEAMACGTPVVCSNAGALPEVVGDAALSIDPTDESELAAAMRRVIMDAELRGRLVGAGLQRARRTTWDAIVEKTEQLYHDVLSSGSRDTRHQP